MKILHILIGFVNFWSFLENSNFCGQLDLFENMTNLFWQTFIIDSFKQNYSSKATSWTKWEHKRRLWQKFLVTNEIRTKQLQLVSYSTKVKHHNINLLVNCWQLEGLYLDFNQLFEEIVDINFQLLIPRLLAILKMN